MYLPVLNLPNQELFQRPKPYIKPRNLSRWLEQLNSKKLDDSIVELTEQILALNKSHYPSKDRLKLMLLIQPRAHEIMSGLEQTLSTAKLPYKDLFAVRQINIIKLIHELASSYKLIVSELAILDDTRTNYDSMLSEAIYFSMHYLSLQLLQVYRCYQPEPEDVWSELHQLYRYALTLGLQDFPIDDQLAQAHFPAPHTVDKMYQRIVLLAIAEPYNLMQNESDVVYRLTTQWIEQCNIIPLGDFSPNNEYIIDLTDDHGPRFVSNDNTWIPSDGRIIDISLVKKKLENDIQKLLISSHTDSIEPETLLNRNLRNMLMRISDNWRQRVSREMIRGKSSIEMVLINSMNACHFFLSQQSRFTPAMDEYKMMTSGASRATNNKKSQYQTEPYKFALESDKRHNRTIYLTSTWYEVNNSEFGLALSGDLEKYTRKIVKVGDLIAYKAKRNEKSKWQFGIVRWQKSRDRSNIEIGVMTIASDASPVAVKGISGVGAGTDYYRSLMIEDTNTKIEGHNIIVPAFLYDINSVIAVNTSDSLYYLRLTKLLLATGSIAQFQFKAVDISNVVANH
ncbi:hypothetical protein MNBD_GAMMA22-1720 [hydrothermal vent metagenome]|uniref:GTPase n=1 Tax=hydrothermal vent metagenome TaxID=652676 RepID=A0A3B0ZN52_9ZZZZ